MTTPRQRQRGAVTLIGALFIVIVLSLMAIALLRMAGSNILDSAGYNDAVEALFVAETGVEHASFLYASTADCPGLAGTGPVNTGRGSFLLSNAVVQPGGECRVTVSASVGSAPNTTPAARTVDADLRLSRNNDGWIVGDNGTILQWDGAAWNAVASPTTDDLFDVHCVNPNDCKAVGENATIIHWNGASWSTVASNTPTGFFGLTHDLFAVSCEPNNPNNCYAAGGSTATIFFFFTIRYGVIQHWDGSSWSNVVNQISGATDWRFNDLSCPSTTCYVVAASGFIGRYDPGTGLWSDDSSNSTIPMNGINCTADDNCWAVGNITDPPGPGADWNMDFRDTGWTPVTVGVDNQSNKSLNAVSCVDSNNCWAVGDHDSSRYVLGQWDGFSWTARPFGNGAQRENLNAVHCLASDDCWAVGDYRNGGNVIHFDGSGWSYIGVGPSVTGNPDLNGVHFPSGGGGGSGSVTLIRWQEIIGN